MCYKKSDCHRNASEKLQDANRIGIDALLSKQVQEEQARARKALLIMFSSISFLSRQGLSFQGHEEETGAFHNLVRERMLTEAPELLQWIQHRNNWMSNTIQNEMIEQFDHSVLA